MKYKYSLVLSNGQVTQFQSDNHITKLKTHIIDGARFVNFEDVPILINLDLTKELIINGKNYEIKARN